ncbi:YtxH domain-containing protein [Paenibacillus sp. CAU 1782]
MHKRKGSSGFLLGALAGGVLGSITALLFAPKSGKELRGDIASGAQKVGESTRSAATRAGDATGRLAKEIGSGAVKLFDRTKEVAGSAVHAVKGVKDGEASHADGPVVSVSSLAVEASDELGELTDTGEKREAFAEAGVAVLGNIGGGDGSRLTEQDAEAAREFSDEDISG